MRRLPAGTGARDAARFALAHPRVELELVAEDRIVDPVEDNYDLVIRINPPADELLIGRRMALQVPGTRHSARITGRVWANALDVLAAAAIDGAGIERAPSRQVADDIQRGRLRRILQDYETMPAPVNVIFERARRTSPFVRAFLDYLVNRRKGGRSRACPASTKRSARQTGDTAYAGRPFNMFVFVSLRSLAFARWRVPSRGGRGDIPNDRLRLSMGHGSRLVRDPQWPIAENSLSAPMALQVTRAL